MARRTAPAGGGHRLGHRYRQEELDRRFPPALAAAPGHRAAQELRRVLDEGRFRGFPRARRDSLDARVAVMCVVSSRHALCGDILAGKRTITADTDLRLCRFFGLSDGWWLCLQADFDTEIAKAALAKTLAKIKPWSDVGGRHRAL
jgi:addiction module HigA family antidote